MKRRKFYKGFLAASGHHFSTTAFTLIEVVVSLAILGIGLSVIIELLSGGLRLGKTSEDYTRAMSYARMKMEEIISKQDIQEGTDEGDFDKTFHWQVDVKKIDLLPENKNPDLKPPVYLFQVKVNILWKSGLKERSAGLETYKTGKSEDEGQKS
jgi:prepilin-type N-terminal cleavage/methylation domain-containing protein